MRSAQSSLSRRSTRGPSVRSANISKRKNGLSRSRPTKHSGLRAVTQFDLAELVAFRQRKQAIDEAIEQKCYLIKHALEHGAGVQHGARSVRTVESLVVE